eukprot:GHRR01027833.1.p1 GENE.GHRR01027833.1~~GHRR01027833.1.p1  ORF type:complete len:109 (-),score=5.44 GHRR01027833.1:976-1302(-)
MSMSMFMPGCELRRRVNLSLNAQSPELQVLHIIGMFHRWGVHLCGPSQISKVVGMYKHFSKHFELVPIFDKTPVYTTMGLSSQVFSCFGDRAKVVTTPGNEYKAEFDA